MQKASLVLENLTIRKINVSTIINTQKSKKQNQIIEIMRRKFQTNEERIVARRLQNAEAQRRCRAKKTKGTQKNKQPLPLTGSTLNNNNDYLDALFTMCSPYPFTHSITLTNSKIVTVNMHNRTCKDLILNLITKGYVTNYIKTVEYDGTNYHTHFLVRATISTKELKAIMAELWGNGFFKVVAITSETHRLNAIRYCFKKLEPNATSNVAQQLVDSWDTSFVETFEEFNKAKFAFLEKYKEDNGLNVPIDFSKYKYKPFVTDSPK